MPSKAKTKDVGTRVAAMESAAEAGTPDGGRSDERRWRCGAQMCPYGRNGEDGDMFGHIVIIYKCKSFPLVFTCAQHYRCN
jgi:hypothetical protein